MSKRYGAEKVNGDLMRSLMRQKAIFPDELAASAHMSLRVVQKMMASEKCRLDFIRRVADKLDTTVEALLMSESGSVQPHQHPPSVQGDIKFTAKATAFAPELLLKIAQEVAVVLRSYGLSVTDYQCQLVLHEFTDTIARIIVLVYGILDQTRPFWCYVAVKPSKYREFLAVQNNGALDLHAFEPFGEIIISGEGDKGPPEEVTLKVKEVYGTDVKEFFSPIDADIEVAKKVKEYEEQQARLADKP